jgi:hypothetical protein
MSGSGGSIGGGGGGFAASENCESLVIVTQINSPQASVVERLQVGNVLDVVLAPDEGATAVALEYQGQRAGGILHGLLYRLRECLANGTRYQAHVQSIDEGQVRVRIRSQQ